ncbi:unnamed protein product [Urochloa decumbens]|uniref:RING-type domain-containing protein n=1 Tax=Urochloa decumbens TaxID=240449 RepID=A0ABC9FI24_9POAL
MAAQDDAGTTSHVVVDIVQEEEEAAPKCAVCTEPMEWVAMCPCGHHEVCAACAARIRFFQGDRRCCICRSHCHTVFVTKATTTVIASHQEFFLFPPSLWRAIDQLEPWYLPGMGAYFDDLCQYEEMSKVCANLSVDKSVCLDVGARSQQPAGSLNVAPPQPADDDPEECSCVVTFFFSLAINLAFFTFFAVVFVVAEHPYQKVLAVLAFVVISSAITVYTWHEFNSPPNGDHG